MENQKTEAIELFNKGYNCSQVVINAFGKEFGLSKEQCLKIGTAFGGGMAKQQFVCGAVTGAYMILGLKYGKHLESDDDSKVKTYDLVYKFNDEFLKQNESIHCKEILGYDLNTEEGLKKIEEENLHEIKCEKAINTAIEIIEKLIY